MAIYFYKEFGPLGYLANYSDHGFYKDGKYWPTAEHYFQAQKFFDEEIKERIRLAKTPKEASTIGRDRSLPLRKDWEDVKQDIMLETVLLKFKANPDILELLLATGEEELVEHTTKEYYWGCGPDKSGQNNYGKILVKARSILRKGKTG